MDRSRLASDQDTIGVPVRAVITRVEHVPASTEFIPRSGTSRGYRIYVSEHWNIAFDILGPAGVPARGQGTLYRPVERDDLLPATYVADRRAAGGDGSTGRVLFERVEPPDRLDWLIAALCAVAGLAILGLAPWFLWRAESSVGSSGGGPRNSAPR